MTDAEKLADYEESADILTCGYGLAEMDFDSLADAAKAARDKIASLKGQVGYLTGELGESRESPLTPLQVVGWLFAGVASVVLLIWLNTAA